MNVIYPLYKHWSDMILNGEKTLEFRTSLPNELHGGDKIYFYETKKHGGCGMVVGYATLKGTHFIDQSRRRIGPDPFLFLYWAKYIAKDDELVGKLRQIGHFDIPGYYRGTIYGFLFFDEAVKDAIDYRRYPKDKVNALRATDLKKYLSAEEKTRQAINGCDNWLSKIGYYDENGISIYTQCLDLCDPIRLVSPQPISAFQRKDGAYFKSAPQGFLYTTTQM